MKMNMKSPHSILATGFAALLLVGCADSSSKPDGASETNTKPTLTIHVLEMCDRLGLD